MDVAKVLSPQAAEKINGPFERYDLVKSLLFALPLDSPKLLQKPSEDFFLSFHAVAVLNVWISCCGCTRFKFKSCEANKGPQPHNANRFASVNGNRQHSEQRNAIGLAKCDIFQIDFYYWICMYVAMRPRSHKQPEKESLMDSRTHCVVTCTTWYMVYAFACIEFMQCTRGNIELQSNRNSYSIMPSLCLCP